eukprot:10848-Heterococcus_DN1.PRE.1
MLTPRRPQINGARFNRKLLKLQRTISVAVYDEMQHVQLVVEQRQFNPSLFKKRLPRLSTTVEVVLFGLFENCIESKSDDLR